MIPIGPSVCLSPCFHEFTTISYIGVILRETKRLGEDQYGSEQYSGAQR